MKKLIALALSLIFVLCPLLSASAEIDRQAIIAAANDALGAVMPGMTVEENDGAWLIAYQGIGLGAISFLNTDENGVIAEGEDNSVMLMSLYTPEGEDDEYFEGFQMSFLGMGAALMQAAEPGSGFEENLSALSGAFSEAAVSETAGAAFEANGCSHLIAASVRDGSFLLALLIRLPEA